MSEPPAQIEHAVEAAKSGQWDRLLSEWERSDVLAGRCSRHAEPGSSWSFLHQAARCGHARACRALIARGAFVDALSHDSRTPADVAGQNGHHELAAFLRDASIGRDSLWAPQTDPDLHPASNWWREATPAKADVNMKVGYGGGVVRIRKGEPYFTDALGRVLVGWHGTFNPPRGMDGDSMIE